MQNSDHRQEEQAVNIAIGGKYRITSDAMNVIVEQLVKPKDAAKEPAWKQVAYLRTPEQAIQNILDREARLSEATTLKELLAQMRAVRDDVRDMVQRWNEQKGEV